MKNQRAIYLAFFLAMSVIPGCRKIPKDKYTSRIGGSWIGTGSGCAANGYDICGDAFFQFTIETLNNKQIRALTGATLNYKSANTKSHTVVFEGVIDENKWKGKETLVYNYADNIIIDDYEYHGVGNATMHVEAKPDLIDPSMKALIAKVVGTKVLSGIVYDTFVNRTPRDSIYTISDSITFSAAGDMILKYDRDYAHVDDDELHLKSVDEQTQTIVFQTFHTPLWGNASSTLTYSYQDGSSVFAQDNPDNKWRIHLKLR